GQRSGGPHHRSGGRRAWSRGQHLLAPGADPHRRGLRRVDAGSAGRVLGPDARPGPAAPARCDEYSVAPGRGESVRTMTYKCLLFELKDGIATLTLNRPERLNALGDTLRDDLHDAILKCGENAEVRVIVITGAGKGFCSGGDVKAMNEAKEGRRERPLGEKIAPNRDLTLLAMRDAPQPIIAAINGAAAGAGMNLALGC